MAKVKQAEQNTKPKTAVAHARYIRISPRKMRLVTNMVKGMYATEALVQLQFTNKKAARFVSNVIKSALANGVNNFNMSKDDMIVKSITCDMGPKLKRFMPRAQGRATPIRKPTAHLNVVLEEKPSNKKRKKFDFDTEKKESKKEKATQEKTTKMEAAEEKNKPGVKDQIMKGEQEVKKSTVQQKRRLFNRKSGV